jgi:hypothetical protein
MSPLCIHFERFCLPRYRTSHSVPCTADNDNHVS